MEPEKLLREASQSFGIDWGTTAPFSLGEIYIKRIGFGNIPVIGMIVMGVDIATMVPIVRQIIFRELDLAGIDTKEIKFSPTATISSRKRKFVDSNESSPTKGKNKMGHEIDLRFEILNPKLFEWENFTVGKIPERY